MTLLPVLLAACAVDAYQMRFTERNRSWSWRLTAVLEYVSWSTRRLQKNIATTLKQWIGEIRVANTAIIKTILKGLPPINVAVQSSRIKFLAWFRLRATKPKLLYERGSECDKEWPGGRPPLSTRWPWTIRPSLVVLWGVCWMFYPADQQGNRPASREEDQTSGALAFAADWTEGFSEQNQGQGTAEPVSISQTWQAPAFIAQQIRQLPYSTSSVVPSQYSTLIGQPYSADVREYQTPVLPGGRQAVIYSHGTPHDFQDAPGQAYLGGTSGQLPSQSYPHTWTSQPLHQGQATTPLPVTEPPFSGYPSFPAYTVPWYPSHIAPHLRVQFPPPVLQDLPSHGANWEEHLTAATEPALYGQHLSSPYFSTPYSSHRLSITMADTSSYPISPKISPRSGREPSVATSLASASSNLEAGSPAASDISRRPSGALRRSRGPPRNDEGEIICDHPDCQGKDITFSRTCEWNKHMDRHERPYKCREPGCENSQGFTYSGGLLRHQREVHKMHQSPKQPFFCPVPGCNRSKGTGFTRRENLEEHKRRRHLGQDLNQPGQPSTAGASPASVSTGSSVVGPSGQKRKRVKPAEEQEEVETRTADEEAEEEKESEDEGMKRLKADLLQRDDVIRRQGAELNQLQNIVRAQQMQMAIERPSGPSMRPPASTKA